jgi:arabinogalactan endo-1,4-beta-galactosidase
MACSIMRIRLWVDPYDENGKPYHGGTNDWTTFLKLAKLGMSKGYSDHARFPLFGFLVRSV